MRNASSRSLRSKTGCGGGATEVGTDTIGHVDRALADPRERLDSRGPRGIDTVMNSSPLQRGGVRVESQRHGSGDQGRKAEDADYDHRQPRDLERGWRAATATICDGREAKLDEDRTGFDKLRTLPSPSRRTSRSCGNGSASGERRKVTVRPPGMAHHRGAAEAGVGADGKKGDPAPAKVSPSNGSTIMRTIGADPSPSLGS